MSSDEAGPDYFLQYPGIAVFDTSLISPGYGKWVLTKPQCILGAFSTKDVQAVQITWVSVNQGSEPFCSRILDDCMLTSGRGCPSRRLLRARCRGYFYCLDIPDVAGSPYICHLQRRLHTVCVPLCPRFVLEFFSALQNSSPRQALPSK